MLQYRGSNTAMPDQIGGPDDLLGVGINNWETGKDPRSHFPQSFIQRWWWQWRRCGLTIIWIFSAGIKFQWSERRKIAFKYLSLLLASSRYKLPPHILHDFFLLSWDAFGRTTTARQHLCNLLFKNNLHSCRDLTVSSCYNIWALFELIFAQKTELSSISIRNENVVESLWKTHGPIIPLLSFLGTTRKRPATLHYSCLRVGSSNPGLND